MRLAHALSLSTLAVALSGASMFAAAQPTQPRVWDASAPSMPPQHQALPASGTIVVQPGDWKAAHAAVAQFPHGHADVVQWEKAQHPPDAATQIGDSALDADTATRIALRRHPDLPAQQMSLLAADTRRAWLRAVAAEQALAAHERMHEAAALGAELAQRMAQVGNFSKMAQARELAIAQHTAAQRARARLHAQLQRAQLAHHMGLQDEPLAFQLPAQLPTLPPAARDWYSSDNAQARSHWLAYRTAYDLAHQQQAEVLPLAKLVQEETVYRYNGMFMGVWQLLAQARATTQAVVTATEAQRDFWLAETDLQLALTGTSPNTAPGTAPTISTSTATATTQEQGH